MNINFPFKIIHNIPLSQLSTFGIGGVSKNYVPVQGTDDLLNILNFFHKEKLEFLIFAGGSNIVFPDHDIDKHILHLKKGSILQQNNIITADAGVSLSKVIKLAINKGFKGLESLSGIPGTLGGAIVGNAGAYGSSVSEAVKEVYVWIDGKVEWINQKDCQFAYRESIFKKKQYIVLKVKLEFTPGHKESLVGISKFIIAKRKLKYKNGLKCPGSFFKNIIASDLSPGILKKIDPKKIIIGKVPSGYLLDTVGARGMSIGDIEIASFHGNLFINKGNGRASDVKSLAELLKDKVYKKYGIKLEEEIRYF